MLSMLEAIVLFLFRSMFMKFFKCYWRSSLGLVLMMVSGYVFAQTANSGFSTFENGAVDTKNLILAVASTVVFAIGIIFVFIGLFNIFKPEERQEPGGKKKGVWQFLLGAIFSAGAGLQLAGGFSQAFFGVDNTDAATEWNTEFKDQSGGG
jgi:Ni,Fe-hydrogenase I cytochrome b subunit